MSRIEQDQRTVRRMIALYCRRHLRADPMPEAYRQLADYACCRLDRCRYGERKTACEDCPTHCYAPREREAIRTVMRWAGPRMLLYHPADAMAHLLHKLRHRLRR